MNWFTSKIRYDKTMPNGMVKKITEAYLFDALSFTEAEARTIKVLTPFISGEMTIVNITPAKIVEIFENEDGGNFYKAKVNFITVDDKGEQKITPRNMLVQAADIKTALADLDEGLRGTMADYSIASIAESGILEIFHLKEKSNTSEESGTESETE